MCVIKRRKAIYECKGERDTPIFRKKEKKTVIIVERIVISFGRPDDTKNGVASQAKLASERGGVGIPRYPTRTEREKKRERGGKGGTGYLHR